MTQALSTLPSAELQTIAQEASRYASAQRADSTLRAYRSRWRAFEAWCRQHGLCSLPADPKTVALYAAHLGAGKRSTLDAAMVAIAQVHRDHRLPSPRDAEEVRLVIRGIYRTRPYQPAKKRAVSAEELQLMLRCVEGRTARAVRDRALLLLGFAGGFRRAELVALCWEDIEVGPAGARITLRRSKVDVQGKGHVRGVLRQSGQTCPVRALEAWLEVVRPHRQGTPSGPVFVGCRGAVPATTPLGPGEVARRLKRAARALHGRFQDVAGHSLRSGFISQVARKASLHDIAQHVDHQRLETTRQYVQRATVLDETSPTRDLFR